MDSLREKTLTPIEKGIKLIGIGKHGSKKLPDELVLEIKEQLKNEVVHPLLTGAFIGALMMKDTEPSYLVLEDFFGEGSLGDVTKLWSRLCKDVPPHLTPIGHKLLRKETLSVEEAEELGKFLFSEVPGEVFRGMAMSILRIRYEADEEYTGLYNVIKDTYNKDLIAGENNNLVQLAEPFDGVEHSYMITPILAQQLQAEGYSVITTCGRTGGPKVGFNTWDLYKKLDVPFVKNTKALAERKSIYGWALDQADVSAPLEKWVDRRKILMKRPFLSTLEKVLNPLKAKILITSVFHIPYLEKMVQLGGMAGFEGVIVLKRGLEGSLAVSLARSSGVLCAAKRADGSFEMINIDATQEDLANYRMQSDEVVEPLSIEKNVELIKNFLSKGTTGNPDFDNRVNLSVALYKKAIKWINDYKEN